MSQLSLIQHYLDKLRYLLQISTVLKGTYDITDFSVPILSLMKYLGFVNTFNFKRFERSVHFQQSIFSKNHSARTNFKLHKNDLFSDKKDIQTKSIASQRLRKSNVQQRQFIDLR